MADDDDDRDEEWFKEVYGKEYTGPHSRSRRDDKQNSKPTAKRAKTSLNGSGGESEEEEGPPDPNAVPTDFTSREAKVWEAKAKAIERNWKRRKEEELNCKICGESGHFAQGCPTTLGGNRKSGDVIERIPLRDKRLKPRIIGSGGSTIQGIEKDTGCRLKLEDNVTPGNSGFYVRISGPDRLAVSKAAGAVRRLVDQVEDEWKQPSGGRRQQAPTRGSNVNPLIAAQMQHIQRLQHGATLQGTPGRSDHSGGDEDKRSLDQSQHDVPRHWDSGSTQGRGGSGQYYHGQTPDAYQGRGRGSSVHNGDQDADFKHDDLPQTLEALERRFVQETMHLTTEQEAEEDKENARHRERMREIQEQYQQKMINLRTKQSKYREDFLRREGQVRQQQYHQHYAPSHYDQYGPSGGNDVQGQLSGYDYGDSLPHYGNAPHSYHGKHGHSQYSYGSRNSPSYQTYG